MTPTDYQRIIIRLRAELESAIESLESWNRKIELTIQAIEAIEAL